MIQHKSLFFLCALTFGAASAARAGDCLSFQASAAGVTFQCADGAAVAVRIITPEIVRVRISPDGRFPEALPIRFGLVKDDWPPVKFTTQETAEAVWIETASLRIRAAKRPFRLAVEDRNGKLLVQESAAPTVGLGSSSRLQFEVGAEEHFYGLGFQRTALDVRGKRLSWQRGFRWMEATVPFFMSTRGYAFYSNNTWKHTFDFTEKGSSNFYSITSEGGQPDYYILYGPSMKRLLDRYTDLTGKPLHTPRWSFGLGYQCRYFEEQDGVLAIAARFRKEDIPLDMMGLEPGWEEAPYAMKWRWSAARFPDPAEMIRKLAKLGVKMELWESGDAPKAGYTDPEVRKRWFSERVAGSLEKGVRWFKQDDPYPRMIESEELLPPDVRDALQGSGGMPVGELRNFTNSLYSDTVFREMRRLTGQRAMVMFNSYGSSIASHRWPFTWGADYAAGVGSLSAGLSGHSMISVAMNNEELREASQGPTKAASPDIHVGHLLPFCYIESWAYYKEPWHYSETLLEANRFYTKLRYRLIPYLYTSAHQSATAGLPMMRAMVLEYQNDPETYQLSTQYMLGDWLLVGYSNPSIYLPAGKWFDFWSGAERSSQGSWQNCDWPETVGGPLFVKAGAIIPFGPVTSFSDQEPLEVVTLDIYPHGDSRYSLYEDDGVTYDYQSGAYATTAFASSETTGSIRIRIGDRQGSFRNMPRRRAYLLSVHVPRCPTAVAAGGRTLRQYPAKAGLLYTAANLGWYYDQPRKTLWVKPTAGWRYDYDQRGAQGDPDRDTAYWEGMAGEGARGYQVIISPPPASRLAAETKVPAFGPPAKLKLELEHPRILADGTSGSGLTATVVDALGRQVGNAQNAVRITAAGEGAPAERALTPRDGVARTRITSTPTPGIVRIRASTEGLPDAEITLETLHGTFELKASPPERIKLRHGSWLKYRVTIYATIKAGGATMKSANGLVHLHVTGPGGKLPEDREARAAHGIAVFKDIFFEPPAKYTFHVTGEGLQPAEIPIY